MSYLMLIVEPSDQRAERSEEAGREAYESMVRYANELKAKGLLLACESLTAQRHGVRVRSHEGEPRLVDGPFTEAKEMIGGFFLLDCKTREEAVAIAVACPAAQWCTVEVRETGPCFA